MVIPPHRVEGVGGKGWEGGEEEVPKKDREKIACLYYTNSQSPGSLYVSNDVQVGERGEKGRWEGRQAEERGGGAEIYRGA